MKNLYLLFILFFFFNLTFAQTVIWEEQFDGGIPDTWEVGPGMPEGAVWQWSADGQANIANIDGVETAALFWGTRGPIDSPSAANGCAMYNSDVYDGGGIGVAAGPFPWIHSGTLTSPSIDLTGYEAVTLKFNQFARANSNTVSTLVEVSSDGGMNWTNFPINLAVVENEETASDDIILVNISAIAGNHPDVRIRFTWNGRYYYWLIDDVQIIETPAYNLAIDDYFYPASSYAQPMQVLEVDTMVFFADVSNIGGEDQTSVYLKATVTDANGNLLFQDSIMRDVIEVDSTYQMEILNTYAPELPIGTYNINYEVYSADQMVDDINPTDNTAKEEFLSSTDLFSKDDGIGIDGIRPSIIQDWEIGSYFELSSLAWGFVAPTVTIAGARSISDGSIIDAQVTILLYEVNDEVEQDFSNFDTNSYSTSLTPIGFQTYEFPWDYQNFDDATTNLLDIVTLSPIYYLEPGKRYFLTVIYQGDNNNIYHAVDNDINYFQVSTVINTDQWFLGGFGPAEAAVVRMNIFIPIGNTGENQLPDNVLRLSPNPTSDQLNIAVEFDDLQDALIAIATIEGKLIELREFENIQNENIQIDMSQFPAGTYFVRLNTYEGSSVKKFNVTK